VSASTSRTLPPEIAESVSVMALIERGKAEGQIAGDDVRRAFEADQIPATQWKNVLRSLNQILEEEGVTLMVSAAEPKRTRKSVAAKSPAKRTATKTVAAKTATSKKATAPAAPAVPVSDDPAEDAPVKKAAAKKATTAKKAVAKKAVAKKAARKRAPARRPVAAAAPAPVVPSGPRVVHWEVQARDQGAQQRFFADVFGWNIDANNPMGYGMVAPGSQPSIGGGIGAAQDGSPRAIFYVQVPDINAALAKIESLGGRTIAPRLDIGVVVMAQFQDPEGNIIGLVEGA
jgi:predicted enzyme related to lactoylglutathione lyase